MFLTDFISDSCFTTMYVWCCIMLICMDHIDAREWDVRWGRVQYITYRNTVEIHSISQAQLPPCRLNRMHGHTTNSWIAVLQYILHLSTEKKVWAKIKDFMSSGFIIYTISKAALLFCTDKLSDLVNRWFMHIIFFAELIKWLSRAQFEFCLIFLQTFMASAYCGR
jgi:hypothetical protein